MKKLAPYLRVIVLMVIAYLLIEYTVEVDKGSVFTEYPIAWLVLGVAFLAVAAIEVSVAALNNVMYKSLDEKAKERYDAQEATAKEENWLSKTYNKLVDSKPMEREDEIVLDHNYDGIRELDNNLPPWWLYGFYASIIFAVAYMLYYHVFQGENQIEEFQAEVAEAKIAIEEYKKTATDLIDVNTVEFLDSEEDLTAGKNIYNANCVACHKADGGGGIGPNLTDEHWILGGGIKNIFKTVAEGGRSGKGMVAWNQTLKPLEMAQVSSYVWSLQDTNPADAKEPQGEIWEGSDKPQQNANQDNRVDNTTSADTINISDNI